MKFKMFVVFLSFIFMCSGFAGETFFSSAYAQDKKIVSKKQTSQKTTKKWRVVTLGEHGQFKGADGFQMALNMAQNMDEIRIEKGTIEAYGLVIPKNKEWANGIKISGGWNETFTEKSNNPEETTLVGNENEENSRILTISNSKGNVLIENITFGDHIGGAITVYTRGTSFINCIFRNNKKIGFSIHTLDGGAIYSDGAFFTDCIFINNSSVGAGGAVYGNAVFSNCKFTDNSARDGGAVFSGDGNAAFYNCTFTNNSASNGGAFNGKAIFSNCTFLNNSANFSGGAICTWSTIQLNDCIFINNSCGNFGGGAVMSNNGSSGIFTNCAFFNNTSTGYGGAVYGNGSSGIFTNCAFFNNTSTKNGGACYGGRNTFINSTFLGNITNESGGAVFGGAETINCIFYKNIASEQDNDITVDGNFKIDYCLFNNLTGVADIGPNNIMGDPKFIDPDNGDFTLASDSPCRNKGKLLPSASTGQQKSKSGIAKKRINMGADLDFKMIKDLFNTQSE